MTERCPRLSSNSDLFANMCPTSEAVCTLQHNSFVIPEQKNNSVQAVLLSTLQVIQINTSASQLMFSLNFTIKTFSQDFNVDKTEIEKQDQH